MRKPAFRYSLMIVGLLAALAIIFSQALSVQNAATEFKKDLSKTETGQSNSTDEDSDEDNYRTFTISATSFPSPAQFGFFQQAICLFEIIFTSDSPEVSFSDSELPISKFFTTILEVIISPNAP